MQEAPAGEQIRDEFERVVSLVEEMTGLKSRWRGGGRIIYPQDQIFAPRQFTARKDWDCGLTVVATLTDDDVRWRVLIHEALHSVSVGLNEKDYSAYRGWEEANVEALQRQMRPSILGRLGVLVGESVFTEIEETWHYQGHLVGLEQIVAELPIASEYEFLRTLLGVRLSDRKAYVFALGKSHASDFGKFKRVYAAASGLLSR